MNQQKTHETMSTAMGVAVLTADLKDCGSSNSSRLPPRPKPSRRVFSGEGHPYFDGTLDALLARSSTIVAQEQIDSDAWSSDTIDTANGNANKGTRKIRRGRKKKPSHSEHSVGARTAWRQHCHIASYDRNTRAWCRPFAMGSESEGRPEFITNSWKLRSPGYR